MLLGAQHAVGRTAAKSLFAAFLAVAGCGRPLPAADGVVVEAVRPGSVLENAGLEAGDLVLAWRGETGAGLELSAGPISTVFDWYWLRVEREPRPSTELAVVRGGEELSLEIAAGAWDARVRPRLSAGFEARVDRAETRVGEGRAGEAVEIYDRLARLARRAGDGSTACWLQLELLEADRGIRQADFQEIAERYLEATRVWRAGSGETLGLARSFVDLADAAWRRDRLELAIDALELGLAEQERLAPGSLSVVATANNLAIVQAKLGNLAGAVDVLERALETSRGLAPEGAIVTDLLGNLAVLARRRGDLETAEERLLEALERARSEDPDGLQVARMLTNLGGVALERGELELAEARLQEALRRVRKRRPPNSLQEANLLHNLASIAVERGDLEAGRALFEEAQAIRRVRAPDGLDLAGGAASLGALARRQGELRAAEGYFELALDIQRRRAPEGIDAATTLYELGEMALVRGELDLAGRRYEAARRIQERLAPVGWRLALTHGGIARRARRTGETELALRHFERAIEILELQLDRLGGSEDDKAGFRDRHAAVYRDYVELLVELGRDEEAFYGLERWRARSLLAMLAVRELDLIEAESRRLTAERRLLAARYDELQRRMAQLDRRQDLERRAALKGRLLELGAERDRLARRVRREAPELAALAYPQPLRLAEVEQLLDPRTLLLAYSVGSERTQLFVVGAGAELEVDTLDAGESVLRSEVELFRRLIFEARPGSRRGERRQRNLEEVGRRLYRLLVAPALPATVEAAPLSSVGIERILILPDGPLHRLPFAALVQPIPADGGRGWRYLVEGVPLHVSISATLYAELSKRDREKRPGPRRRLVAFADPIAAATAGGRLPSLSARQSLSARRQLAPLPASRAEVEVIASQFPGRAEVYIGAASDEETVRRRLPEADYAHFATHAVIDDRLPLDSGLVLSPTSDAGQGGNGLLQAWEIFEEVRLDTELVVLSACSSALGPESAGEGLMGLTRAFHYAGSPSVVASLWQASDPMTAELMERFYRRLAQGESKDRALRSAQLELIGGAVPGGSAPLYWAAFQLYGDWR